eukprot:1365113-Amphidinium_carterae.2
MAMLRLRTRWPRQLTAWSKLWQPGSMTYPDRRSSHSSWNTDDLVTVTLLTTAHWRAPTVAACCACGRHYIGS